MLTQQLLRARGVKQNIQLRRGLHAQGKRVRCTPQERSRIVKAKALKETFCKKRKAQTVAAQKAENRSILSAFGGREDHDEDSSDKCEMFDLNSGVWTFLPYMPACRLDFGLAALEL